MAPVLGRPKKAEAATSEPSYTSKGPVMLHGIPMKKQDQQTQGTPQTPHQQQQG